MNMQNNHLTRWLTGWQPGRLATVALLGALAPGLVACGDVVVVDPPDALPLDAQPPDGAVAIDAGAVDAVPVDAGPGLGYDIYLRGSFNDFDMSAPFTRNPDDTYTLDIELAVGAHELKISDVDFTDGRTWSLAADAEIEIALDTATPLVLAFGFDNNTILTVADGNAGRYLFEVNAANSAAPTLYVNQLDLP